MRFTYRIFTIERDAEVVNNWHIRKTNGATIYLPDGTQVDSYTVNANNDVEVMRFIDRIFF